MFLFLSCSLGIRHYYSRRTSSQIRIISISDVRCSCFKYNLAGVWFISLLPNPFFCVHSFIHHFVRRPTPFRKKHFLLILTGDTKERTRHPPNKYLDSEDLFGRDVFFHLLPASLDLDLRLREAVKQEISKGLWNLYRQSSQSIIITMKLFSACWYAYAV